MAAVICLGTSGTRESVGEACSEVGESMITVEVLLDLVCTRGREIDILSGLCESNSEPSGTSAFRFNDT